jgi:signal transduction histidine kinase
MQSLDAARLQRSVVLYSISAMVVLALAVATAVVVPLYRSSTAAAERAVHHQLDMKALAIGEVLDRARSLVRQTTSRSVIRDALISFNAGQMTLAQLQAFSTDKLADSMRLTPEILGITRLDRKGAAVVGTGMTVPGELWPPALEPKSSLSRPHLYEGRHVMVVSEPILSRDGLIQGADLLLFDAAGIERILNDPQDIGDHGEVVLGTAAPDGAELFFHRRLTPSGSLALAQGSPLAAALRRPTAAGASLLHLPNEAGDGRDMFAVRRLHDSDWTLVARMPEDEIYYDINHLVARAGAMVILLILAATAGLLLLLRPLTGRMLVHTGELQHQVAELKTSRRSLEHSNRELTQFATIAAHDLQEPLRAIGIYVQLLQRRYQGKLDAQADQYIGFVVTGAQRMHQLLNDLLQYHIIQRGERERVPVDLGEVLTRTLDHLTLSIQESDAIIDAEPLPLVTGNFDEFCLLMTQLLENAIKFRHPGTAPHIHITSTRTVEGWHISLQDDGIGIESDYLERIFSPCFRLNNRDDYPGTGMGLAIARKLAESVGGKLWATSQPDLGSVFHLQLPLAAGESERLSDQAAARDWHHARPKGGADEPDA